jgi:metal iron transporter
MNCPSRPDDTEGHPDWNQNPHALSSDLTTRADLNGIVNLREQREADSSLDNDQQEQVHIVPADNIEAPIETIKQPNNVKVDTNEEKQPRASSPPSSSQHPPPQRRTNLRSPSALFNKVVISVRKYLRFVGPGFLIAVAYIDPGNYATDVEAGAATKYRHLFIILMSNVFAIFLQSLCIKLGSVTGLNLAENCRKHLPKWLNILLYLFSESAIIATDIAEVGTT